MGHLTLSPSPSPTPSPYPTPTSTSNPKFNPTPTPTRTLTQVGHLVQLINERLDPNYDGVITREELKLLKQSRLIGTSSVVDGK